MRWSLILSTFVLIQAALPFVCLALAVPQSSEGLERRAIGAGAKVSSRTYRKNSQYHPYVYKFDHAGSVTREKLKPENRLPNGEKMLIVPGTDADHVFEHQMLNNHLKQHGLKFGDLDKDLRTKLKDIMNGPRNMAPVPARINRRKGQLTKHGMQGKAIAPKESRDEYTRLSYGTARNTAKRIDKAFDDHGHEFGGKTAHKMLRDAMNDAKILKPGQPSPQESSQSASSGGSDPGSAQAGPRHPRQPSPAGSSKSLPAGAPHRGSAQASPWHSRQPSPAGSSKSLPAGAPHHGSAQASPRRSRQPSPAGSSNSWSSGASDSGLAQAGPRRSARLRHAANKAKPKAVTQFGKPRARSSKTLSSGAPNRGRAQTSPRHSRQPSPAGS